MKSRRERLFDGFAIASLVLLAATTAWCAGGIFHAKALRWRSTPARVFFAASEGWKIVLMEQDMRPPNVGISLVPDAGRFGWLIVRNADGTENAAITLDPANFSSKGILGFSASRTTTLGFILQDRGGGNVKLQTKVTIAVVPYWALIVVFAILPGLWWWARRRNRARLRLGLCDECGYDLRATPERCPECGTVPAVTSAHAED